MDEPVKLAQDKVLGWVKKDIIHSGLDKLMYYNYKLNYLHNFVVIIFTFTSK